MSTTDDDDEIQILKARLALVHHESLAQRDENHATYLKATHEQLERRLDAYVKFKAALSAGPPAALNLTKEHSYCSRLGTDFLDGRTGDGSVVLSPSNTDPPYSGTHWRLSIIEKVPSSTGDILLYSLSLQRGLGIFRFLDGNTQSGAVSLAPHTGWPYMGTRWLMYQRTDPVSGFTGWVLANMAPNSPPYGKHLLGVNNGRVVLGTDSYIWFHVG